MKELDFERIGKQMPYRVPQGFFESFPDKMMMEIKARKARRRTFRVIASVVAAAFFAGVIWQVADIGRSHTDKAWNANANMTETVDQYVSSLSDEELREQLNYYEADVTLQLADNE